MTTYNGSIANLYIDSELKAYSDRQTCQIKYGDDPFVIGIGYGGGNSFFCGLADNAIIYDRAITDSEVLQHYANPPPSP